LRDPQHFIREIDPDHSADKPQRDIAGPATEVEHITWLTGQFDKPLFPVPVETKRHYVVEQIVPARDRGEQLAHFLRAMLIGLVEFALHGWKA
jgi:hypothetical protein